MKNLKDRVAVVTGAASGIGRATSIALAREGCMLALSDVNELGLAETAAEVRALGVRVCTHAVDVSDKERMQRYADEVIAEYGAVHVLVNNAGVAVAGTFEQQTLEDWEWIVGINFWGVVYGCKFFLPHLKQAGEAHIVNLSSVFGLLGVPLQTSYCATKFAVRGFSEALWVELKQHGVGVTSVHPGGVRTAIAKSMRSKNEDTKHMSVKMLERSGATPEHVAQLIVKAIKKNKMRLLISPETFLADITKRMAPAMPQLALQRTYVSGSIKGAS